MSYSPNHSDREQVPPPKNHHEEDDSEEDSYPVRMTAPPSLQTKKIQQAKPFPPKLPNKLPTFNPYKMSGNAVGQFARREDRFCAYAGILRYPYRYLNGEESERVSKGYFVEGKFQARGWSLFYIHTQIPSASGPLLLLLAAEVEAFFSEINSDLKLQLGFPDTEASPHFVLSFDQDFSPLPRYLGQIKSKEDIEKLGSKIPDPAPNLEEAMDSRVMDSFREKMEAAVRAGKRSSKVSKETRKLQRIAAKGLMCSQLKRARCYLGLRPRITVLKDPASLEHADWDHYQKALEKHEKAKSAMYENIDLTNPTPNQFHRNPVFISVDVECYERGHNILTEIGIATLDTQDLQGLAPGQGGVAWMKKIRVRHFRIKETSHLANSDFVLGCADGFRKEFGVTEWISIKDAREAVASCFRYPFSALEQSSDGIETPGGDGSAKNAHKPHPDSDEPNKVDDTERQIILVGHDIKADIDYLSTICYDVNSHPKIMEAFDTADLFRAYMYEHQTRKLGNVLHAFDITGYNLHNAGNDAAYTLQALIGICVASTDPGRPTIMANSRAFQLQDSSEEQKQQILQDASEWVSADVEEGDGGEPVRGPYVWLSPPVLSKYPKYPKKGNSRGKPDWLTIYGIEKLKQYQAVRAEGQNPPTDTSLNKENSLNPQGTIPSAQSQKPTSSQVKKGELPSEPVRWTAETFPTKPGPTSASAPAPAPAPAVQPIDLSAISPAKLARLALLDSMNF